MVVGQAFWLCLPRVRGRASRTTPRQTRKPCSGCRRCSRISSYSAAVAGPTRHVGADALNRPPPQLKIAMAAGFVDIGRQLGDAIVELDELRASATLGGGCEERPHHRRPHMAPV